MAIAGNALLSLRLPQSISVCPACSSSSSCFPLSVLSDCPFVAPVCAATYPLLTPPPLPPSGRSGHAVRAWSARSAANCQLKFLTCQQTGDSLSWKQEEGKGLERETGLDSTRHEHGRRIIQVREEEEEELVHLPGCKAGSLTLN